MAEVAEVASAVAEPATQVGRPSRSSIAARRSWQRQAAFENGEVTSEVGVAIRVPAVLHQAHRGLRPEGSILVP